MNRLVTKTDFGVGTLADLIVKDRFIKILEKLYEYEELEEQGLLIKLPCKVGDNIYEDTGLEPEDILSNIKTLSNELN